VHERGAADRVTASSASPRTRVASAAHVEGLYSCLDYYRAVGDPFSRKLLARYDALLHRCGASAKCPNSAAHEILWFREP